MITVLIISSPLRDVNNFTIVFCLFLNRKKTCIVSLCKRYAINCFRTPFVLFILEGCEQFN